MKVLLFVDIFGNIKYVCYTSCSALVKVSLDIFYFSVKNQILFHPLVQLNTRSCAI